MSVARTLARRRVPLGSRPAIAALWLAQPTPRSLAAGRDRRRGGGGDPDLGRRASGEGARSHLVRAVSRHPASSLSRLDDRRRRAGDRVGQRVVAILVIGYLAVTLSAAIATEEAHLTEKFGGAYPAYRAGQMQEAPRRFSLARAMKNREYRAVAGLLGALALLSWKAL